MLQCYAGGNIAVLLLHGRCSKSPCESVRLATTMLKQLYGQALHGRADYSRLRISNSLCPIHCNAGRTEDSLTSKAGKQPI